MTKNYERKVKPDVMNIAIQKAIKKFYSGTSFKLVYFEAVANAFDAGATFIEIQINLATLRNAEELSLVIMDNGYGFTPDGVERFSTLLRSRDDLHKGLGRLVFLKYFKSVEIESISSEGKVNFVFDHDFKSETLEDLEYEDSNEGQETGTRIVFEDCTLQQLKEYNYVRPTYLKEEIKKHFYPQFIKWKEEGTNFEVSISLNLMQDLDDDSGIGSQMVTITPDDIPELETACASFSTNGFEDSGEVTEDVKFHYLIQNNAVDAKGNLDVVLVSDGRTLSSAYIGNSSSMPRGYDAVFLIESELFNQRTNDDRTDLQIPKNVLKELNKFVFNKIAEILREKIEIIDETNEEIKRQLSSTYPHLLGLFPENQLAIIDTNKSINIAQKRFFNRQREILSADSLNDDQYREAMELASRILASYILHRDTTIKKLENMNRENLERDIHNTLLPKGEHYSIDSQELEHMFHSNIWLVDDKFMSYTDAFSEYKMQDIINVILSDEEKTKDEAGRPDIVLFFSTSEADKVDIVIIEIKRKGEDLKNAMYTIEQLKQRARSLYEFLEERLQRVWYYGIVDIDEDFQTSLEEANYLRVYSEGDSFYGSERIKKKDNSFMPIVVQLMSTEALISDARKRNEAFMDVLRKSIQKYNEENREREEQEEMQDALS